jgi:hypothetical protein
MYTPTPHLTFRQILRYTGFALGLLVLVGYIVFQARFLIQGPRITLTNEPASIQNERTVTISGKAWNITKITINDRPMFTDKAGYFSEALVLENGYTIATIAATDRYGRETQVVRPFVYTPLSINPQ